MRNSALQCNRAGWVLGSGAGGKGRVFFLRLEVLWRVSKLMSVIWKEEETDQIVTRFPKFYFYYASASEGDSVSRQ